MLRKHVLNEIEGRLNHANFQSNDFAITTEVRTSGDATSLLLRIGFRYTVGFEFLALIPDSQTPVEGRSGTDFVFRISTSPGRLQLHETQTIIGITALYNAVNEWVRRIDTELSATPMRRELEATQEEVAKIAEEVKGLDDKYFTKEEATSMSAHLGTLEAKLEALLAKEAEKDAAVANQLRVIHEDIEGLQKSLGRLTRPNWAAMFLSRIAKWSKHPAAREIAGKGSAEIVKQLMGGGS